MMAAQKMTGDELRVAVLEWLREQYEPVIAHQVADEFGVSWRTALRRLRELEQLGEAICLGGSIPYMWVAS